MNKQLFAAMDVNWPILYGSAFLLLFMCILLKV